MAASELSAHERGQERKRKAGATKRRRGEVLKLDPAPFAEWLKGAVERHGSLEEVSRLTGTCVRTLSDIGRGKYTQVHVDIVDRALLHTSTHLSDIYPELYE